MEQKIKKSGIIGDNIQRHRIAANMTQEELSAKLQLAGCDISRGTLAKLEAGIRHISVEELKIIRNVLGMEYEEFFNNN